MTPEEEERCPVSFEVASEKAWRVVKFGTQFGISIQQKPVLWTFSATVIKSEMNAFKGLCDEIFFFLRVSRISPQLRNGILRLRTLHSTDGCDRS